MSGTKNGCVRGAICALVMAIGCDAARIDGGDGAGGKADDPSGTGATCPWTSSSDFVFETADDMLAVERELTVDEIAVDLACLEQLFAREYVAASVYADDGISLVDDLRQLAATIDAPMTQSELASALIALHEPAYDLHLTYSLQTAEGTSSTRLPLYRVFHIPVRFTPVGGKFQAPGGEVVTGCAGFAPIAGHDGGVYFVKQTTQASATETSCALASGSLPTKTFPVAEKLPDVLPPELALFHVEVLASGILYVRIPDFRIPKVIPPEWQALLDTLADTETERPIVFDLRGNRGGDPRFAWMITAALMRQGEQVLPGGEALTQISVYGHGGLANTFFDSARKLEKLIAAATSEAEKMALETQLAATLAARDYWLGETAALEQAGGLDQFELVPEPFPLDLVTGELFVGTRARDYSRPIAIVIDKNTASAGEGIPSALGALPGAVTIGMPTAGLVRFGTPGLFALPSSHLMFRGVWYALTSAGWPEEGTGVSPELYVPAGDSLQAAIDYLSAR